MRDGEMAELVEGARLEIAYTGNRIKGSNPFLSAKSRPPVFAGGFDLIRKGIRRADKKSVQWTVFPPRVTLSESLSLHQEDSALFCGAVFGF